MAALKPSEALGVSLLCVWEQIWAEPTATWTTQSWQKCLGVWHCLPLIFEVLPVSPSAPWGSKVTSQVQGYRGHWGKGEDLWECSELHPHQPHLDLSELYLAGCDSSIPGVGCSCLLPQKQSPPPAGQSALVCRPACSFSPLPGGLSRAQEEPSMTLFHTLQEGLRASSVYHIDPK